MIEGYDIAEGDLVRATVTGVVKIDVVPYIETEDADGDRLVHVISDGRFNKIEVLRKADSPEGDAIGTWRGYTQAGEPVLFRKTGEDIWVSTQTGLDYADDRMADKPRLNVKVTR
jgi:hypothetical protein